MTTDIARTIRALLDKAENTEFVHERDAFTAKAVKLMAEYRITEAMVDAARDPEDRRGRIGDREIQLGSGPYVRARLALLCQIADAHSCSTVTHVGWDGRIATLHGYTSDLERVEMLYTSLLVQATVESGRVGGGRNTGGRAGSTVSVRRSFLFGFASKVGERLAAAQRVATEAAETTRAAGPEGTSSVAMVLADRRADVDDYVRQRYGRLGTLRTAPVSATGYDRGRAAGDRADLGTDRTMAPGSRGALSA